MSRALEFYCDNDDCENAGQTWVPLPGEEATCPTCGWFGTAVYE